MKKELIFSAITIITSSFAMTNYNKANVITKDVMQTLGKNLKHQIKTNSFPKALEFCAYNAYLIIGKISQKYPNTTIKRISLKPRNPVDTPNEKERVILESFEKMFRCGIKPKEIIIENKDSVTIYKPIMINKKVCLKCHGNVDPNSKIGQTIKKFYPYDKATGYKLGDFRGAFVITMKK